ncbi:MAG: hypothetical protein A2W93_02925 [Bacteroidetes bacterium GWF2_43_63]|nr:MAG: hypothetical protein A2W94_08925 [Bacteroidetes bacterium GWE2_42_42]OFY53619.1 MAG: hypothetical protein A2W93_02925 [Bacteroidetes bacterium GWF2_43_63]HBG71045.1 AAA family ATPase [Bacteroidales bacterium]HCB63623.1 AAA family ATPase [Bacteroidales bacterium]HCY24372.1 AAA family ATPase [Bacteroidales bacterium]
METLRETSRQYIADTDMVFIRYALAEVRWDQRLTGITGARGVGKSTLMLQYLKANFSDSDKALYVSCDDLYFSNNTIVSLANAFVKQGGTHLFLDEVHKYPGWSREIKNIYDRFKKLTVVFSGSSALDIYKSGADLSRRALHFHLNTLSLREYIGLFYGIEAPVITLDDILQRSTKTAEKLMKTVEFPIRYLHEYYQSGCFPFAHDDAKGYHRRLLSTINQVTETDLPALFNVDYTAVVALRKLLTIMAGLVPFKPNITELGREMGLSRETIIKYIQYLSKADIFTALYPNSKGLGQLSKPEKVYLHNPNLLYALSDIRIPEKGTIRETFFMNQVSALHKVFSSPESDFLVDGKYTFEIGGRSKKKKQIAGIRNAYVVQDDIEYGHTNVLPLWLFGFLY